MICLLIYLEGSPLSVHGIPPHLSIVSLSVPDSTYSVSSVLSMDPLMVLISTYGTPQTSSIIPLIVLVFKYGITRSGFQPSSMLPSQVGSQLSRFTMPPIIAIQLCLLRIKRDLRGLLIWVNQGLWCCGLGCL